MDVAVDVVLGDGLDNTLGTLDVDILEGEVPSSSLARFLLCEPQLS